MVDLVWSANIGFENFCGAYSFNKLDYACEAVKEIVKDKRNFDKVEIKLEIGDPKNV